MVVGGLPCSPRVIAVDRPHREHPQALLPGKNLKLLSVLDCEYLTTDVVNTQHRRNPQLVPAKAFALAGKQIAELGKSSVGGINGVGPHRLELRRSRSIAVVHRHHIDAIHLNARLQSSLHSVETVLGEALG